MCVLLATQSAKGLFFPSSSQFQLRHRVIVLWSSPASGHHQLCSDSPNPAPCSRAPTVARQPQARHQTKQGWCIRFAGGKEGRLNCRMPVHNGGYGLSGICNCRSAITVESHRRRDRGAAGGLRRRHRRVRRARWAVWCGQEGKRSRVAMAFFASFLSFRGSPLVSLSSPPSDFSLGPLER